MLIRIGVVMTLAVAAAPATAQEHQHGQHQQERAAAEHRGMGDEMAGMHFRAFHPDQLLAKKSDLKLTPEQIAQLERIAADGKAKHDEAKATHDAHERQMAEALDADAPNVQVVASHFQAAHGAMGAAHWAGLEASLAGLQVLTAEQRAMVKAQTPGCCKMKH
jgi:hypothetical protein